MIKLIIKVAIAALIANACWRVGSAYLDHYRFTDAVQSLTQFRGSKSDADIRNRMFELASEYNIPVDDSSLSVRSESRHTIVEGEYKRSIQLVPGYTYEWPFSVHVDTMTLEGLK